MRQITSARRRAAHALSLNMWLTPWQECTWLSTYKPCPMNLTGSWRIKRVFNNRRRRRHKWKLRWAGPKLPSSTSSRAWIPAFPHSVHPVWNSPQTTAVTPTKRWLLKPWLRSRRPSWLWQILSLTAILGTQDQITIIKSRIRISTRTSKCPIWVRRSLWQWLRLN